MDCVWDACKQHLAYLGKRRTWLDYNWYFITRVTTQGWSRKPTFGGIVPYIVSGIAGHHGMWIETQHKYWTPAHYASVANFWQRAKIIPYAPLFGNDVKQITLAPAIYLSLDTQHAHFAQSVPNDPSIVMALQIRRKRK